MRLHGQTPRIEGGFLLFPKRADWLEPYLSELLSFPSSNYDDQVDSTVYALAWIGENPRWHGNVVKRSWLHYYTELPNDQKPKRIYMACDTTVKDEGQSDWTVCTVWQLFNQGSLFASRGARHLRIFGGAQHNWQASQTI